MIALLRLGALIGGVYPGAVRLQGCGRGLRVRASTKTPMVWLGTEASRRAP